MEDSRGRWARQAGVAAAGAIFILCCMSSAVMAAVDGGQMRSVVEHFSADRMSLMRTYGLPLSPDRMARMETFYADELAGLKKLDFDAMSEEDKVDYLLLQNRITSDVHQLSIEKKQAEEMAPLLPFAKTIVDLDASISVSDTALRMIQMTSVLTSIQSGDAQQLLMEQVYNRLKTNWKQFTRRGNRGGFIGLDKKIGGLS